MYVKFKDKGLNVIAVNTTDSLRDIQAFRKELKLTMPLVAGNGKPESVKKLYGVEATPTNYILDKDGKVVASFVGYDEKGIKRALAKLGIKI